MEGHGERKVAALNDNQEQHMDTSESASQLDVTESTAQNKDQTLLVGAKAEELSAKDMLLSSTEKLCPVNKTKTASTARTTEDTSCFETGVFFSSEGKRSKNGSDNGLAKEGFKEKDLESASSKSYRRKSTRHEPYKKAK